MNHSGTPAEISNLRPTGPLHSVERNDMNSASPYIHEATPIDLPENSIPILLSPGLGNRIDKLAPVLQTFADHGRVAIGIEHHSGKKAARYPEFADARKQYPKVEVEKAAALLEVITSKNIEKVDLIGFCEGAVNGGILASAFPELVRNFVAVNPAGMTGPNDTFSRVAKIFIKKSIGDIRFALPRMLSRTESELASQKISLSWNRMVGLPTLYQLSQTNISPLLVDLETKGVRVGVLQSRKDSLYPYEMVGKNVPETISAHATFSNQKLGHAALLSSHELTVGAVVQMVDSLNSSRDSPHFG